MEEKVYVGEVCWFNNKRGYGFVSWLNEEGAQQKDIFIYWSDINCTGFKTVKKGQKVSFELGHNKNGQLKAINITAINAN